MTALAIIAGNGFIFTFSMRFSDVSNQPFSSYSRIYLGMTSGKGFGMNSKDMRNLYNPF